MSAVIVSSMEILMEVRHQAPDVPADIVGSAPLSNNEQAALADLEFAFQVSPDAEPVASDATPAARRAGKFAVDNLLDGFDLNNIDFDTATPAPETTTPAVHVVSGEAAKAEAFNQYRAMIFADEAARRSHFEAMRLQQDLLDQTKDEDEDDEDNTSGVTSLASYRKTKASKSPRTGSTEQKRAA